MFPPRLNTIKVCLYSARAFISVPETKRHNYLALINCEIIWLGKKLIMSSSPPVLFSIFFFTTAITVHVSIQRVDG